MLKTELANKTHLSPALYREQAAARILEISGHSKMEPDAQATTLEIRDHRGHWRRGVSGNPRGRPRGSKNRCPRRRADRGRAAEWTRHDWAVVYRHAFHETDGDAGQKHAAAFSECMALWLLLNPPAQRAGLCAQCAKPLDVPLSSVSGAPVQADGAWLHWACLPWFLRARWDAARAGLQRLGIGVGSI
jgi:Family of unknown function (DUF5681)